MEFKHRGRMVLVIVAACSLLLTPTACQTHPATQSRTHSRAHVASLHTPSAATSTVVTATIATPSSAPTSSAETTPGAPSSLPSAEPVAPLPNPIATLPQPTAGRVLARPRDLGVPILMYHVIAKAPPGASNPDLYVTPEEFVQQMTYLSKHGYHAVTLKQVYSYWHGKTTLPSKPVVLSFDDGDMPDFRIVAPLLKEVRWPGVLNLIVGSDKHPRMKKEVVRALIAEGWEIDSHTISHVEVPSLSDSQLRFQIGESRHRLQKWYGVPVDFFCYPYGRFNARSIAAVKAAGYLGATSTRGGLAKPREIWKMRRVRVSGGLSPTSFAKLIGDAH